MNLELAAMRWLWLDKGCHYILEERCPRYAIGSPDVIGVTVGRYMTEIEIKRSASDFRADAKKPHRANRCMSLPQQPRQFYYLMPEKLAVKLQDKIPDWAGLMACPFVPQINILKIAPVNKDSRKLNVRECVRMARLMTSHMLGYALNNETHHSNFLNRDSQSHIDWIESEHGIYEI